MTNSGHKAVASGHGSTGFHVRSTLVAKVSDRRLQDPARSTTSQNAPRAAGTRMAKTNHISDAPTAAPEGTAYGDRSRAAAPSRTPTPLIETGRSPARTM